MQEPSTDDMKRGDDAADHAPKPKRDDGNEARNDPRQDAPNYDKRTDKGEALRDEDVSSANDE